MKLIKNIVTVAILSACCLVVFVSVGIYFEETSDMKYFISDLIRLEIEEADLVYLGESYGIYSRENYSYYRLTVVMNNDTYLGIREHNVFFIYRTEEGAGYHIREIEQDGTEEISTEREYFPADKQAVCFRILEIPDGCSEFDLVYTNTYTDEEETIHITI